MTLDGIKAYLFYNRLRRNIIFWLLFSLFIFSGSTNWLHYVIILFAMLFSFGVPGYIHNLWIVPQFLIKRKYALYIILFLLLIPFTMTLSYYTCNFVNDQFKGISYMFMRKAAFGSHLFPSIMMLTILAMGKFSADAVNNHIKLEKLQTQRLESELESLKSQVNPHFLFNALNTIYGMARRTDNETAGAVLQLSDILRYVLYECDVQEMGLEKEVNFLVQYIEFARLRMHDRERISLDINTEVSGYSVAPLILIPFVENAIKHGLGKHSQHSWIDIKLDIKEDNLFFECANSNYNKDRKMAANPHSGIGLKNVKRRLELLYPGTHSLDITDTTEQFKVTLNIKLT